MLTEPPNSKIRSPNQTRGKPFFSRKSGLADVIELCHSTQPTSDNAPHTGDASRSLQSSPSVGGSTRIELQHLPTDRLRRPDTETGLRAPTTNLSELATNPSRNPVSEIRNQPEKTTKKPPTLSRRFIGRGAVVMIYLTAFAIFLGGTPGGGFFAILGGTFIACSVILYFCMTVLISLWALQLLPIY